MEKEIEMKKEEMKRCAGEAAMLINQFMSGDMTEENEKKIDELLAKASKCQEEINELSKSLNNVESSK